MISKLEDENRVADEAFKELVGEFRQNICLMAGRMETHEAVCSDIHGLVYYPPLFFKQNSEYIFLFFPIG